MSVLGARPMRFIGLGATAGLLSLSACSGSDGTGAESTGGNPTTTAVNAGGPTSDPSTDTAPTSTTVAASAVLPVGQRWETTQPLLTTNQFGPRGQQLLHVAGAAWYLATRYNGVAIFRSTDGGVTWDEMSVPPPAPNETLKVTALAEGPNGRLVAFGARGIDCTSFGDVGNGYQNVECDGDAASVLVSDDDGATWRRVDPAAMAAPAASSIVPSSIIATADGYVAAGSVRGPDWYARLWSSPDGENWVVERDERGTSPYAGAEQLLYDGTTMVLLLSEFPCGEPFEYGPRSWPLGAQWATWPRVLTGGSTADLALLAPTDHPFVRDLDTSDCDLLRDLETIDAIGTSHPGMTGLVVGGVITLLEDPRPTDADLAASEADDSEAALTSGIRRISQLVDGTWVLTEIGDVQTAIEGSVLVDGRQSVLIDMNGDPGLLETRSNGYASTLPIVILPDGAGWVQRVGETGVIGEQIYSAVGIDGAITVSTDLAPDPWASSLDFFDTVEVSLWSSREGSEPAPCELGPRVQCPFADFTQLPGYPDFAGIDLTGADLAYANFGDADMTGANFTGARLWAAQSGPEFSADGATFTGARMQDVTLRSTVGADFTDANLSASLLYDASGASFSGALASNASITVDLASFGNLVGLGLSSIWVTLIPPESSPFELSLAGLDLTNAYISAEFDGPLLRIVSLDGAILVDTTLQRVDLTAIDPTVVDLSQVDVWDERSLCPDGLPPDDLPIGTCVRAPAPKST